MIEEYQEEKLIYQIKRINTNLEIWLEKILKTDEMSGTQVWFSVYMLRHHLAGGYITQMCREIGVSKATLSVLVKKMREKGYLSFQENPKDIRKKKVIPTQKLISKEKELLQKVRQMEIELCGVLTEEERQKLGELEHKIWMKLKNRQ